MQISLVVLEPRKTEFGGDLWRSSNLIFFNCRQLDQISQGCAHQRSENLQRWTYWHFSLKTVLVLHPSHFDFFNLISSRRFYFGGFFLWFCCSGWFYLGFFLGFLFVFVVEICFLLLWLIQQDEPSCVFMTTSFYEHQLTNSLDYANYCYYGWRNVSP